MKHCYDRVIIGAGLYGLYFALLCSRKKESVLVLERDPQPFMRATYINQARVHMGYHYPRSYATAIKSKQYFERFVDDFGFCIYQDFEQIYATSRHFSWTDQKEFRRFCESMHIRCDAVSADKYFRPDMCDGAFVTKEYSYDAQILKDYLLQQLSAFPSTDIICSCPVRKLQAKGGSWYVTAGEQEFCTPFILNATYASVNDIHRMAGFDPFSIKYEKCEIILCHAGEALKNIGITVMDGPFFSIMPFGKTGLHSLTSVTFTPHETSYADCAEFPCQLQCECSSGDLHNCNECDFRPASAWDYMQQLARKYLNEKYMFSYYKSLFSMKPILKASELDDSRPTVVRCMSESPAFFSVLSGKINTVYDLAEVLEYE